MREVIWVYSRNVDSQSIPFSVIFWLLDSLYSCVLQSCRQCLVPQQVFSSQLLLVVFDWIVLAIYWWCAKNHACDQPTAKQAYTTKKHIDMYFFKRFIFMIYENLYLMQF